VKQIEVFVHARCARVERDAPKRAARSIFRRRLVKGAKECAQRDGHRLGIAQRHVVDNHFVTDEPDGWTVPPVADAAPVASVPTVPPPPDAAATAVLPPVEGAVADRPAADVPPAIARPVVDSVTPVVDAVTGVVEPAAAVVEPVTTAVVEPVVAIVDPVVVEPVAAVVDPVVAVVEPVTEIVVDVVPSVGPLTAGG